MVNKGWKGESKRHSIAAKKNRGGRKMEMNSLENIKKIAESYGFRVELSRASYGDRFAAYAFETDFSKNKIHINYDSSSSGGAGKKEMGTSSGSYENADNAQEFIGMLQKAIFIYNFLPSKK